MLIKLSLKAGPSLSPVSSHLRPLDPYSSGLCGYLSTDFFLQILIYSLYLPTGFRLLQAFCKAKVYHCATDLQWTVPGYQGIGFPVPKTLCRLLSLGECIMVVKHCLVVRFGLSPAVSVFLQFCSQVGGNVLPVLRVHWLLISSFRIWKYIWPQLKCGSFFFFFILFHGHFLNVSDSLVQS